MKTIQLFLLLTCYLNLTGCGQTGPLYLPGTPAPIYVPHEPTPTPDQDANKTK
jgi:predicted small lipoprotein YifL